MINREKIFVQNYKTLVLVVSEQKVKNKFEHSNTRMGHGSNVFCKIKTKYSLYPLTNHLDQQFQMRRFFKFQPIRNMLVQPCFFLPDQGKMRNICNGPHKLHHLYEMKKKNHLYFQIQRRRLYKVLANQKHEQPVAAMFLARSRQNEENLKRGSHKHHSCKV